MIRTRVISAVLIGISALALTACGGGDGGASAASWETAPAAAPATAATQADKQAGSDNELCEAVDQADTVLTGQMIKAMQGGGEGPSAADITKGLTEFAESLRTASDGGDSTVAKAMQKVAADVTKVAQAPDPATEGANPVYEEANTELEKACQAVGVKVKL